VSWLQVYLGQGLMPEGYNPLVDIYPDHEVQDFLDGIQEVIRKCVDVMPRHADYIAKHCAAAKA
jgi:tryptophan halogenase